MNIRLNILGAVVDILQNKRWRIW